MKVRRNGGAFHQWRAPESWRSPGRIRVMGESGQTQRLEVSRRIPHSTAGGFMLIECLVYIGVLLVLLGIGYAAMYRCMENSVALRRSTEDIARALNAGERWRADVRAANGTIGWEETADGRMLRMPGERGEVVYQFTTNGVLRRVGPGSWSCILTSVKSSTMHPDARDNVTAWRWELELQPRSKKPVRVRPLFTFLAVPGKEATP